MNFNHVQMDKFIGGKYVSGGGGGGGTPANTTNVQTIREAPEIEARRLGLMDRSC
jgi:hypothetical protein